MKVIASTIKSAQWQAWLSQQTSPFPIVQSGTSDHPSDSEALIIANPCTLADIEQDLLSFDEVVLHVWDAKSTLADALRNGADDNAIEETLAEWMRFTKALLAWLPNHQHKVNLISHTHATFYIEAWQGWLTSLGIEWPDAMSMAPRTQQDEYDIFAAYYISQRPEFAHLEQLLFSVTLPMGDSYPTLPFNMTSLAQQSQQVVEQLRYAHKQQRDSQEKLEALKQAHDAERAQYEEKLAQVEQQKQKWESRFQDNDRHSQSLTQENNLLLTELHRMQEALESALIDNQRSEGQYQESVRRTEDAEKKQTALKHENQALITELHNTKQSLDEALAQQQRLTKRSAELEQTIAQHNKQYAQLNADYTASQNKLTALEQKKHHKIDELTQHNHTLTEENSMIIAELHRVQETLEALYNEKSALDEQVSQQQEQLTEQAQQLKANNAKIASLSKRVRLTKLELAQALASKTLLEKELTAHHNSALWKVTVPVRKFRQTPKRKRAEKLAQQKLLIELSSFFDKEWYLNQYPDVEQQGLDPIDHYLRFGAQEGRNPSPDFDTRWYLKTYPDVAESGLNPLIHFIKFGNREERQTAAKLLENKM
ncbi:hypothetical protein [Salinivibrio sp. SS2]|uniref:hypothetical protein n=1 Tax=Salinivibrio sp. SS2 TaxID=1892894 RepID=UPI00084C9C5F|nr:hypothetical protein [Salinivibrio sp. DV]ODP99288.1 hypothetical protein BGK46_11015 [Salinivibrio sp. DV]